MSPADPAQSDLIVVGGGPAGLCHAFWRRRNDSRAKITIIERAPEPGGWVRTFRVEGFSCEIGPQGFRPGAESDALLAALGVEHDVVAADPDANLRFIGRGGRLHPLPTSPGELRRSDLLSTWGKLRLFLEPLCFNRSQPGESLADFVARRFGAQARPLASAMARGVFAGDAERLEARAFRRIVGLEEAHGSVIVGMIRSRGKGRRRPALCTFRGGMELLPQALRRELGSSLVLGRPARRVSYRDGAWHVELGGQVQSTLAGRELTVAAPAHVAAGLLTDLDPRLSEELAAIRFAPVANVYLGFWASDVRDRLRGFGFLVEPSEQTPVLGVLFCSAIFPGCAIEGKFLARAMIGGTSDPDTVRLPDDELVRLASDCLRTYTGCDRPPIFHRVRRAENAIPQFETGHRARVERIRDLASRHPGLQLRGCSYDDVSVVGQMSG